MGATVTSAEVRADQDAKVLAHLREFRSGLTAHDIDRAVLRRSYRGKGGAIVILRRLERAGLAQSMTKPATNSAGIRRLWYPAE